MRKASVFILGLGLVLALAAVSAPARERDTDPSGTLGGAIGDLANEVKTYMGTLGKNRVSIGQFPATGDRGRYSSAGPLLQTALEQQLKSLGVDVVAKSGDLELNGDYIDMEDTNTGRQFVQIKLELSDKQGATRLFEGVQKEDGRSVSKKFYVKNEADIAKLLGPNVYVPPAAPEKVRIEAYKTAIDKPEPFIVGKRVFAGKGAPFAVEILTAPPRPGGGGHNKKGYNVGQPRPDSGFAFIGIPRDHVYAVRLVNNADYDVAVDLRIDGLSMYHASDIKDPKTGLPAYRFVIVRKYSTADIYGWFINLKQSDEFLVTEYARSEAGKIGQTANLGTITATFHAAWPTDNAPPRDEPKNANEYSFSADATARGSRVDANFALLDYQIGVFRAAVSVRYTK